MIFRILVYIFNILMRFFLSADPTVRSRKDFRLPSVVPIVFYNGTDAWTAIQELKDYQMAGGIFGEYVLNLKYYLVDLNQIDEEYILNTNTVIDNIMYCDKFRRKAELIGVVRDAFMRVNLLGGQDKEEFYNWVSHILITACGNNKDAVKEILISALKEEKNMEFKYNIERIFEMEREEAVAEGLAEGRTKGLAEGLVKGRTEQLIIQVQKKKKKGLSVDTIADMLEEEPDVISEIYSLVQRYPERTESEIYQELERKHPVRI